MRTASDDRTPTSGPTFYTVPEAARLLRVDPATIYRAIRADQFPAIRIPSRCIVPARALEAMAEEVAASGKTIDVASMAITSKIMKAVEDTRS
jgi:excisionase family DNA binding protein